MDYIAAMLTTITELPEYIKRAEALLTEQERKAVIYYYHDERIPLYLLTLFGKNEQTNLSKSDRNALSKLVSILVDTALEKHHG